MYTICFEVRISSSEFELHKMKFGLDFVCYTWFRCIARNWYLDWIQHRDSEKNESKTELSISIDWIGLENGNLIGLTIINMIFISMSFFLKGKIFFPFFSLLFLQNEIIWQNANELKTSLQIDRFLNFDLIFFTWFYQFTRNRILTLNDVLF